MNEQQQETLENLRNAIKQNQWNMCCKVLAKLLPDLKQTDSIKIIVRQAHRFLSDLFRAHPEDENVRRALEALNNITSLAALNQQGQLIDPLLDKYWDWPGVGNFRNAFKGISKPQQYFDHPGEYTDTLVSLISRILTAIETSNYWGGNPEFSKTFFGPEVRAATFMLARHYSDPQRIVLRASLWTEIVNELEMALQVG
jgi:hypothetical protein